MQHIYKIWFAKKGSAPLGGALNEYRLSLHKVRFPSDTLNLITNLAILSDNDKMYVQSFCQKHHITLIDLTDIEQALDTGCYRDKSVQQELLAIAKIEANAEFGNLAAASDIVRILSPVTGLGMYMDIDVTKVADKPTTHEMGFSFTGTLEIAQVEGRELQALNDVNNNIFYFDEKINPLLPIKMRANLLEGYKKITSAFTDKMHEAMSEANFCPADIARVTKAINKVLEKTSKEAYPIFTMRTLLKKGLQLSLMQYKVLYRAITMINGPDNFRDSIWDYIIENQIALRLTPKRIRSLFIKLPFKDDEDASWFLDDRIKSTETKLQKAAHTLTSAFVKYQYNNKKNKKVLIYNVKANSYVGHKNLKVINHFEEITESDVRGTKFTPSLRKSKA